jgi:hypothetical protein
VSDGGTKAVLNKTETPVAKKSQLNCSISASALRSPEPVGVDASDALQSFHEEAGGCGGAVGTGPPLSGAQPGVLQTRVS